jgi:hypothetical protein
MSGTGVIGQRQGLAHGHAVGGSGVEIAETGLESLFRNLKIGRDATALPDQRPWFSRRFRMACLSVNRLYMCKSPEINLP